MRKSLLVNICLALLLWGSVAASCTGRFLASPERPAVVRNEHLAIVTATEQDTLESLAQTYLGDPQEAWRIAAYNDIQNAPAGRQLVIPLQPLTPGGLRPDGYQVVPVLCYQRMGPDKRAARGGVSSRTFEGQVQFLKENGFQTISLKRLSAFLSLSGPLPPKAILITFDSTERWVFDIAYPILKKYGFAAAVFVATAQIGKPHSLNWNELAAMAADGFDIGTSGVRGRSLIQAANKTLEAYARIAEEEVSRAQKSIAQNLNTESIYFAYPGGKNNDRIISLLKKHGYRGAFTQQAGQNPFFAHDFQLRRTIINHGNEARFRQYLTTFHKTDLQ